MSKVFKPNPQRTQRNDDAWDFWRLTNEYLGLTQAPAHEFGHNPDECMICESFENINNFLVAERNDLEVARRKHG